MNTQPFFSLILYVDHAPSLPAALEALKTQELFRSSTQLIAVAPESADEVRRAVDLCAGGLTYPPEVLDLPFCSMARAYNAGLEDAAGSWINFSLASAVLSENALKTVETATRKHNTISAFSLCPICAGLEEEIPYRVAPQNGSDISVDLNHQFRYLQMLPQAYFFRRDILEGLRFDEDIRDDALHKFLLQALERSPDPESDLKAPVFRFLAKAFYRYTVPLEDNPIACALQHEKWWYLDSVRDFALPFLRSFSESGRDVPPYVQYAMVWLIGSKYRCNFNDANKHILDETEFLRFHELCSQAMTCIDNRFIQHRGFTPPVSLSLASRVALLRGKAEAMNCDLRLTVCGQELAAQFQKKDGSPWDGRPNDNLAGLMDKDRVKFEVRLLKYEKKCLVFNGFLFGSVLVTGEPFRLYAQTWIRGRDPARYQQIEGEPQDVYCLKKEFGQVIMKDYPVSFRIPMKKGRLQKIRFFLEIAGMRINLCVTFPRSLSKLSNFRASYWQFTKNRVLMPAQDETLQSDGQDVIQELHIVRGSDRKEKLRRELAFRKAYLASEEDKQEAKRALRLRTLYFLTRPFFRKKRIWVSFDKLYKAGDNGEYMYQYGRERIGQSGMPDFYYIVSDTSPDYPRLKGQPHAKILVQNSTKCLLTCMHAEAVLATHSDVYHYFNDSLPVGRCLRSLYRSKIVCIQHGLSINQIAHFQNQWFDDTELYTCASPFEKENLSGKYYGYQDSQLQLTGLARYDGLKNQDKKLILITPTWRKDVASQYVFGVQRGYNPQFKESAYFHVYSTLINDPRLLETAKRTGYRIMYLLHPATSSQLPDFEDNGYVELVAATGDMSYEQVLTEASLMVTDYSGVQFDFAYQRKPLVYYQPDTLPPHYEEGGLIYETMGFGPICRNNDEVVTTLCEYMEAGCKMLPEYVKRADAFFSHRDFNNCERIYRAVEDMLAKK